jgi:hypothetical protein
MIPSACELRQPLARIAPAGQLSSGVLSWDENSRGLTIEVEGGSSLCPLIDRLNDLCDVPAKQSGAIRTNPNAAINALRLFCRVAYDITPLPELVSLPQGHVQLRWCQEEIELKVEVTGDGVVRVHSVETGKPPESWEEDFNYGAAKLGRQLDLLTIRAQTSAARFTASLLEKIEKFRRLPANWGTYGEHQVNSEACDRAKQFIVHCGFYRPHLRLHVYPTSAGHIGCEFKKDNQEMALIFTGTEIRVIRDDNDLNETEYAADVPFSNLI